MKHRGWLGLSLFGLIAAAGCGSTVEGSTGGGGGAGSTTCTLREPQRHRAAGETCGPSTPEMACTTDTDCVVDTWVYAEGTCVMGAAGGLCDFNECTTDASCPTAGNTCSCQDPSAGWAGSRCLSGNCRTDADCGAGGYCSPTTSECGGSTSYHCHTCLDACTDDADCVAQGSLRCGYEAAVGRWTCGDQTCSG